MPAIHQVLPAAELFILRFFSLLSSTNIIHFKKSMTLLLKIVHGCCCDRFLAGPFFLNVKKMKVRSFARAGGSLTERASEPNQPISFYTVPCHELEPVRHKLTPVSFPDKMPGMKTAPTLKPLTIGPVYYPGSWGGEVFNIGASLAMCNLILKLWPRPST